MIETFKGSLFSPNWCHLLPFWIIVHCLLVPFKKCCVFANQYTLDDDFERPMDYNLSLSTKVFS